jgi:hypothetical protein
MLVHSEYCDKNSGSYTGVKIAVQFFAHALSHGFPGLSRNDIRLAKTESADKLRYQAQRLSVAFV